MTEKIQNFYDLDVWKKAHELTLEIYIITKNFPRDELFGIISQLRRAASSVAANLAEGFARYHFNDKIRFYHHARGSASEAENFLILSRDLGYIDYENWKRISDKTKQTLQLINGLIRSAENHKI